MLRQWSVGGKPSHIVRGGFGGGYAPGVFHLSGRKRGRISPPFQIRVAVRKGETTRAIMIDCGNIDNRRRVRGEKAPHATHDAKSHGIQTSNNQ